MYPDFRPDPSLEPPQPSHRPDDTPLERIIREARDSGDHLPSQDQQRLQGSTWSRGLDVFILCVFALLFFVVIVKNLAGASATPSVPTSPSQQPPRAPSSSDSPTRLETEPTPPTRAPQAPEGAGVAAPSIPRPTQPQEKPRTAPTLAGMWEGTYRCLQGTTGLRLLVRTEPAGSLQATFVFYPIPSNPSVPSGSFEMTGSSSSDRVTLQQSRWIKAPPNYEMVDLRGTVSGDSSRFAGTVSSDAPGCTTFALRKLSPIEGLSRIALARVTGTWVGTYRCSQGETGLRLVLKASPSGALTGTFNFYPIASNSSVPSGSFTMRGVYSVSGLNLIQEHWIRRPPGYEMVDLVANPPSRNTLTGRVVSVGGCTTFSVRRT